MRARRDVVELGVLEEVWRRLVQRLKEQLVALGVHLVEFGLVLLGDGLVLLLLLVVLFLVFAAFCAFLRRVVACGGGGLGSGVLRRLLHLSN